MIWPAARNYVDAITVPEYRGPEDLRTATLREGLFGLPAAASGQNAIVFPLETTAGPEAVKCFTSRPGDELRQRYLLLGTYLRSVPDAPLVRSDWCDQGLLVMDRWWPVVRMPWLAGVTLDVAVEERLDEPQRLRQLAETIRTTNRRLGRSRLAHGDLQHGNILVADDATIHLVDYDSVWFPGGETLRPEEVGHRNYQHPDRLRTGAWGPEVDTFAGLVIYLSLYALAGEPGLWSRYNRGENLLVVEDDLADPANSAVLAELGMSDDPWVAALARAVASCATAGLHTIPALEHLLGELREHGEARLRGETVAPGFAPDWIAGAPTTAGAERYADVDDDWAAAEIPDQVEFDFSAGGGRPRRRRFWRR